MHFVYWAINHSSDVGYVFREILNLYIDSATDLCALAYNLALVTSTVLPVSVIIDICDGRLYVFLSFWIFRRIKLLDRCSPPIATVNCRESQGLVQPGT